MPFCTLFCIFRELSSWSFARFVIRSSVLLWLRQESSLYVRGKAPYQICHPETFLPLCLPFTLFHCCFSLKLFYYFMCVCTHPGPWRPEVGAGSLGATWCRCRDPNASSLTAVISPAVTAGTGSHAALVVLTGAPHIAETDLQPQPQLPLPPKVWGYRHTQHQALSCLKLYLFVWFGFGFLLLFCFVF